MIQNLFHKTEKRLKKVLSSLKRRKIPPPAGRGKVDTAGVPGAGDDKDPGSAVTPVKRALKKHQKESFPNVAVKRKKRKKWEPEVDFPVDKVPGKTRFHDIGIPNNVLRGIADQGFLYCMPIQAEALPHLLKGRDVIGHANTGTGKTAVFLITLFSRLQQVDELKNTKGLKGLIIAPTRELVIQIGKEGKRLGQYTHLKVFSVYGGSDYSRQIEYLETKGCDIIVATPGRLLDFCRKKIVDLSHCKMLVIDEADRMLDMGFIPDVRKIIHLLPDRKERQTLMFSATIGADVKRLASQWCSKPEYVTVASEQVVVESVEQLIYLVTGDEKYTVLYNTLKNNEDGRIAIFANQKVDAKRLATRLQRNGIDCVLLSGDVPQNKRLRRLEQFRSGKTPILVATDVAGRGVHIEGITHVINYDLPYDPVDYVHRIGRTGRAGASGVSIGFACEEGGFVLPDIEEFIGRKLACSIPDESLLVPPPKKTAVIPDKKKNRKSAGKTHSSRRRYSARRKAKGTSWKQDT